MTSSRPGPRSSTPTCSVIIPVYNRARLTRQCLEVLLGEPKEETAFEVIVVDDASSDGTSALLREYGDAIRVVTHDQNTGFAGACNDGAGVARGQYLVFLNNDTHPLPGWLDALTRYTEQHPGAAIVGSKLLFPDGTVQHAGVAIMEDLDPRHIYAGFPSRHPAVNRSRRFPIVTAACALFRREAFEKAEGFDDAFSNGFEDVDLCLRLGELGYEVHYCHESVLYHLETVSRDHTTHHANHLLYRRRWAHKVRADAIQQYIADGLLEIGWRDRYPFSLTVAPELATVNERERKVDRMLGERAEQLYELSRENVKLRLAVIEAGLDLPDLAEQGGPVFVPKTPKAVSFMSDTPGDAMRYRCDHAAEQLTSLGASADVSWLRRTDLERMVDSYGCFVFHRIPVDEHIERFIGEVQRRGAAVIFDTDDLVFELGGEGSMLQFIAMSDVDRRVMRERLDSYARTMALCDAVFVTTEPLAEQARRIHPRVFVLPNTVSDEMVRLADEALAERKQGADDKVTLAYFSGTATHDRDFGQAADAVVAALAGDAAVRMLIVGNLRLDSRFDEYRDRITEVPIQPWQRLPRLMAGVDVNLAPLEPDNPFTDSKSCIKYLEAALLGVPTVASPRYDFRRAITNGENGLLAESPDDWYDAVQRLVASPGLRQSIGRAAFEDVRANHTTHATARRLYDTLAEVAADAKALARPLALNWLVSDKKGSGAARDLADALTARGHHVNISDGRNGLQRADALVAVGADAARTVATADNGLFKICLLEEAGDEQAVLDLPVRVVRAPIPATDFEELLQRVCFARMSDMPESPSDTGERL